MRVRWLIWVVLLQLVTRESGLLLSCDSFTSSHAGKRKSLEDYFWHSRGHAWKWTTQSTPFHRPEFGNRTNITARAAGKCRGECGDVWSKVLLPQKPEPCLVLISLIYSLIQQMLWVSMTRYCAGWYSKESKTRPGLSCHGEFTFPWGRRMLIIHHTCQITNVIQAKKKRWRVETWLVQKYHRRLPGRRKNWTEVSKNRVNSTKKEERVCQAEQQHVQRSCDGTAQWGRSSGGLTNQLSGKTKKGFLAFVDFSGVK